MTDTGSLQPSPEALAWQRQADAWAERAESDPGQAIEPANRWSEVASTGRTAFPADGVGWRTETSEWRATGGARWRQTTEWRSTTGSHGWRSTTEAWRTSGNGDLPPPADTPAQQPAISSTAWPTTPDAGGDTGATDSRPSWQQFTDQPTSQQTDQPPPSWQQVSDQTPSWRQPAPRPPAESSPSWQQLVDPDKSSPGRRNGTIDGSVTWADAPSGEAWMRGEPETPSRRRGEPEVPGWQRESSASWQTPRTGSETPSWQRADPPSWQTPPDDGRHLVREDDRAAWRRGAELGEASRPIGRRRAPETGSRTSGGTGWTARSDADSWPGHTDTGSIQLYPEPENPTWGARSEGQPPRGYAEPPGRRALPASGYDDPAPAGRHGAQTPAAGDQDPASRRGRYADDGRGPGTASGYGLPAATPSAGYASSPSERGPGQTGYGAEPPTGYGTAGPSANGRSGYGAEPPTTGYGSAGPSTNGRTRYSAEPPPDYGTAGAPTNGRSGYGAEPAPSYDPAGPSANGRTGYPALPASGYNPPDAPINRRSGYGTEPAPGYGSPGAPANGRTGYGTEPAPGYGSPGAPANGRAGYAAEPPTGYDSAAPPADGRTDVSGYALGGRRRVARYTEEEEGGRPGGPLGAADDDPRYVDDGDPRYVDDARSAGRGAPGRRVPGEQQPSRRGPDAAPKQRYNQARDDWREHTGSWSAEPDTSSWTRDPDTGQWSRSKDDPRVMAWRTEAARREAAQRSAARRELPAAPADEQDRGSWPQPDERRSADARRRDGRDDDRGGPAGRAAMPAAPRSAVPDDTMSRMAGYSDEGPTRRGMPDGPAPRSAMPDGAISRRRRADGSPRRRGEGDGPPDTWSSRGVDDGTGPSSPVPNGWSRRGDGPDPRSATPDTWSSRDDGPRPRSATPDTWSSRDDGPRPRSATPDTWSSRDDGPRPRSATPDTWSRRGGGPDQRGSGPDTWSRRGLDDTSAPNGAMPDTWSRRGAGDGPTPRGAMAGQGRARRGRPDQPMSGRRGASGDWGSGEPGPRRSRRTGDRDDDDPSGDGYGLSGDYDEDPDDYDEPERHAGYGAGPDDYDDVPGPRGGYDGGPRPRSAPFAAESDLRESAAPEHGYAGGQRALPSGGPYRSDSYRSEAHPGGQLALPSGPASRAAAPVSGVPASGLPSSAIPGSGIPGSGIPGSAIPGTYGSAAYRSESHRGETYEEGGGRRRADAEEPAGADAWRRDLDPEAGGRPRALPGYGDVDEWRAGASRDRADAEDHSWPPRGAAGRQAVPGAWQLAEREEASRGHAVYREGSSDDWRRELAQESELDEGGEPAEGEPRRYGTSDFVPFRSSGAAAVPGASKLSMTSTSMLVPAGGADPMSLRSARASNGWAAPSGAYERRSMTGGYPELGRQGSDLLDPGDEDEDRTSGGPLAAVGYTVIWYGVPVVLFVLYLLIINRGSQTHALDTAAKAAPQFGISLVLSMIVAVGIRWASGTWKAISVGLAAAVVGGGLATVLSSAITGNSLS